MLNHSDALRVSQAYLFGAAAERARGKVELEEIYPAPPKRRVLVVEFRDEVYACLKTLLQESGLEVERAERGDAVAECARRFAPDLILVNEDMPDESGWLIACKLRLGARRCPAWLYTSRLPRCHRDWRQFAGVAEVIDYGGVLLRLTLELRARLRAWLAAPRQSRQP
jgi:CheY-like chemotaxis protein